VPPARKPPSNRRCNLKQRAVALIADYVGRRGIGRVVGLKPVGRDDYVLAIEDARDERIHAGRTARDFEPWLRSVKEGRYVFAGLRTVWTLRGDSQRPGLGPRDVTHVHPVPRGARRARLGAPPRHGVGRVTALDRSSAGCDLVRVRRNHGCRGLAAWIALSQKEPLPRLFLCKR
jgi:hypothetical protein